MKLMLSQFLLNLPFIENRHNRQIVKYYFKKIKRFFRAERTVNNKASQFERKGYETFFGYYDISPLSLKGNKLLAHCVEGKPRKGEFSLDAEIGFFDIRSKQFTLITKTTSWCWQMGSRLRWHPIDSCSRVFFNSVFNDKHSAILYDIASHVVIKQYPRAFFDVANTGEYAVSVNFSRLGRLRPGYGYRDLVDETMGLSAPKDDGLWLVYLESMRDKLLVSFDTLANFEALPSMSGAEHYINMIMISPSGERIAFLHLWITSGGISYVRLVTMNSDGKELFVHTDSDAKPSHGCWLGNDTFLMTLVYTDGSTEYKIISLTGDAQVKVTGFRNRDGHPTLSPDGNTILTDSYPDEYGEQNIEVYNLSSGELTCLGKYAPGRQYVSDELRCDLHPRWAPTGDSIIFDSSHLGSRSIYMMQTTQNID